jgi:hypothetical protein
MRTMVALVVLVLLASVGYATVDEDFDQVGVYFDLGADVTCISAAANIPFSTYVILTRPSEPEVSGFEFGYRVVVPEGQEGLVFRLANTSPCIFWDGFDWPEGDYVCGWASPAPFTGDNVILVTWQFMLLVPDLPMQFYLGPATVESIDDGLPAYQGASGILPLGVSSGDPALPVAAVNGDCSVVSVEGMNFGRLKSLYR